MVWVPPCYNWCNYHCICATWITVSRCIPTCNNLVSISIWTIMVHGQFQGHMKSYFSYLMFAIYFISNMYINMFLSLEIQNQPVNYMYFNLAYWHLWHPGIWSKLVLTLVISVNTGNWALGCTAGPNKQCFLKLCTLSKQRQLSQIYVLISNIHVWHIYWTLMLILKLW